MTRDYMLESSGITRDPYTRRDGTFLPAKIPDARCQACGREGTRLDLAGGICDACADREGVEELLENI